MGRFSLLLCGALASAAVVLPVQSASAYSCSSLAIVPVGPSFYVDVRDDLESFWIYEESNGIAGLQKGGSGDEECAEYDAFGNWIPPDTVIF